MTTDPRIEQIRALLGAYYDAETDVGTEVNVVARISAIVDREPRPEQKEGPSPWDAYVKAYRAYQDADPHGAVAHPTAHHMHALEAALQVAQALPGSETEWGWRAPWNDGYVTQRSEFEARRMVEQSVPGARVLVRREVGPWTEVQPVAAETQQPSPGPGCYPPVDGWDGVSITEDREQQRATVDSAHAFLGGPALTTDAELRALTPDQLEKCVHRALQARDVQAVEGYLLLMALKDPGRAQLLMDTMKVGLNLAKEHRP